MSAKKKPPTRLEAAKLNGRTLATFEITHEFDALISQVRAVVAGEQGRCSRVQALERMGREGAKKILGEPFKPEVITGK